MHGRVAEDVMGSLIANLVLMCVVVNAVALLACVVHAANVACECVVLDAPVQPDGAELDARAGELI